MLNLDALKFGALQDFSSLVKAAVSAGMTIEELSVVLDETVKQRRPAGTGQRPVGPAQRKKCPDCGRMMRLEFDDNDDCWWDCYGKLGCSRSIYVDRPEGI